MQDICAHIASAVGGKFPTSKNIAVGGFIFLRFINPAIVAPDSHNLVKTTVLSKELRRGLILISKVIQNLANNLLFGTKESFMIGMNELLNVNMGRVNNFLREISHSSVDAVDETLKGEDVNTKVLEQGDTYRIHRYLVDCMVLIEQIRNPRQRLHGEDLLSSFVSGPESADALAESEPFPGQTVFSKLSSLLAQLGPPPETVRTSSMTSGTTRGATGGQLYKEFMQRFQNRNVDSIVEKDIFYEGGQSKERRPVLHIVPKKLVASSLDMELVLYCLLKVRL